jgi:hypothetical protein
VSVNEVITSERTTALVKRERPPLEDDLAMQKLWVATQRREWKSLAVIAGDDDVSTLDVATRLAEIAWWYKGQPTNVLDLRKLGLRLVDYQLREMAAQIEQGDCVIVALSSVVTNPTTVAVATAVEACILAIKLGTTRMDLAEKNIEEIGRDKFIGTIILGEK